ncbi:MAG: hypothetical protein ABIB97_00500 [Patescibacteria group bacterium]
MIKRQRYPLDLLKLLLCKGRSVRIRPSQFAELLIELGRLPFTDREAEIRLDRPFHALKKLTVNLGGKVAETITPNFSYPKRGVIEILVRIEDTWFFLTFLMANQDLAWLLLQGQLDPHQVGRFQVADVVRIVNTEERRRRIGQKKGIIFTGNIRQMPPDHNRGFFLRLAAGRDSGSHQISADPPQFYDHFIVEKEVPELGFVPVDERAAVLYRRRQLTS